MSSIAKDEVSQNAMGGTELMKYGLEKRVDPEILKHFHITASRYRGGDPNKINLYWLHDLPGDPESDHLKAGGWNKFERLIFASNWQMQQYVGHYGMPWYKCLVMQNAIDPIEIDWDKKVESAKEKIKIIYHTTPHRGLNILIPVFDELSKKYDNIELDVYSSFKIYGWEQRDEQYQELFEFCKSHPKINYHGSVPNEQVKEALKEAHIFAYPSTWPETSCISLIEAMSAGCLCVHSNYAALPETSANWTWMYQYQDNVSDHANVFYGMLENAIKQYTSESVQRRVKNAKNYTDLFYNWDLRAVQWTQLLNSILHAKGKIPNVESSDA